MRFRPIDEQVLIRGFLYYFLKSKHFFEQAEIAWTGTAQKNMGPSHIKTFNFYLPPLAEQKRIVTKLDNLFAHIRRARQELDHIPKLIERYKQAILSAAVRGDLTADWRKENVNIETSKELLYRLKNDSYILDNLLSENDNSSCISVEWSYVKVEEIGQVFLGRQRSPKNHQGPNMRLYVRAANITWDGWDLSDVKEMNFDDRNFHKYQLKCGDVLINEGSGSADEVGKPAIWNNEIANCCFQNTLICVRPFEKMSEYLYFVFLHAAITKTFVEETRGVNIFHIGKERLSQFRIPLPSLDEQKEIVKQIQERFQSIDRLEQEYQKAIKLCDRLEQSTLAKAFRGEIVSQDSNDEPASLLLERIQKEREKQKPPKKKQLSLFKQKT